MLRDYETALKAAADPNRARILKMLERGELCVCQIVATLGLSQSTVSKHMAILRSADLVEERKEGRWVHFRLSSKPANEYAASILALLCSWLSDDPMVKEDAEKIKKIHEIPLEKLCGLSSEEIFCCKQGQPA